MGKLNTKKRINLSASEEVVELLENLARRDEVPVATKAIELIKRALQIEEDEILDTLADSRDTENSRYLSHKEAWK